MTFPATGVSSNLDLAIRFGDRRITKFIFLKSKLLPRGVKRRQRGRRLGLYIDIYSTGKSRVANPTSLRLASTQGCLPPSMPAVPHWQTLAIPVRTHLLPHSGARKPTH